MDHLSAGVLECWPSAHQKRRWTRVSRLLAPPHLGVGAGRGTSLGLPGPNVAVKPAPSDAYALMKPGTW